MMRAALAAGVLLTAIPAHARGITGRPLSVSGAADHAVPMSYPQPVGRVLTGVNARCHPYLRKYLGKTEHHPWRGNMAEARKSMTEAPTEKGTAAAGESSADRVSETVRDLADSAERMAARGSSPIVAWLEVNRAWADGLMELGQEVAELTQSQARRALDASARIGECREIDQLIATQGEIMGETARAGLDGMRRIATLSTHLVWNQRPLG